MASIRPPVCVKRLLYLALALVLTLPPFSSGTLEAEAAMPVSDLPLSSEPSDAIRDDTELPDSAAPNRKIKGADLPNRLGSASAVTLPSFAWTRQFGSSGQDSFPGTFSTEDNAPAIALDSSGNIYVAGSTYGALPGEISSGVWDAFVRKYDSQGNTLWTRQFGTTGNDYGRAIAVDGSNIYVAGQTKGAFPGLTSAGQADCFVRKYDSQGSVVWTRQFGHYLDDDANGIAVDGSGNIFIAGQLSPGTMNNFVCKYNSQGAQLWIKEFTGGSANAGLCVGVDTAGNSYVGGYTYGTFQGQTSSGAQDAFIARHDSSGNFSWVRQFGTSSYEAINRIAVDSAGNIFAVGYVGGALPGQTLIGGLDAFIRKYDSAGNILMTKQFGTSASDIPRGMALDSSGNIFVAGWTDGVFSGQTSLGGIDAFVRKCDSLGEVVWTKQFGTGSSDSAKSIVLDSSLNIYLAGATGGALPGQTSAGADDAFIVKSGEVTFGAEFTAAPTQGAAPLVVTFTDQTTGTPTGWSWNFGDGTGSSSQNPSKTYSQGGNYTVTLTARKDSYTDTMTKAGYISVIEAKFTGAPISGQKPLTVNFTDQSAGTVNSWSWSFGDGTGSSSQNPSKVYNTAGDYNVSLTATGPAGSSTMNRNAYITVTDFRHTPGFSQVVGADGIVYLNVNVGRVYNPSTGQDAQAAGGIRGYDFTLTYPGGVTGNVVNMMAACGYGVYTSPICDIQNAAGSTRINASQTGSSPQAPTTLAQIAPRIEGSSTISHNIVLSFTSLVDVTAGDNIAADGNKTFTVRRGDARADGAINITDALFIAQNLAGLRSLGGDLTQTHAVNGASAKLEHLLTGEKLNITDALFVAQKLAGLRDDSFN